MALACTYYQLSLHLTSHVIPFALACKHKGSVRPKSQYLKCLCENYPGIGYVCHVCQERRENVSPSQNASQPLPTPE